MKNDILNLTGRGVKIAVIDSGVSKHEIINPNSILSGRSIDYNKNQFHISDNFYDVHGHGTAIVGILSHEVPNSNFHIIKILDNNKSCCGHALVKAIEMSLEMDVDILNLSLGTENMKYEDNLKKLCKEAYYKKIYMVTASNNNYRTCLPYKLSNVFKVLPGTFLFNNKIYYIKNEFLAQGAPQIVPWLNNSYSLIGGSSFATPHVSAALAKLIEKYGKVNYEKMDALLKNNLVEVKNKNLVNKQNFGFIVSKNRFTETNHKLFSIIYKIVEDFLSIKLQDKPLWKQGLTSSNAYLILKKIEDNLNINLDYLHFNLYDFYNITTLTNKIKSY